MFRKKNTKRSQRSSLHIKKQATPSLYKKRKATWLQIDAKILQKFYSLYYIAAFGVIAWFVYFFVFSDYFKIENIEITRPNNNSNIEIAYSSIWRLKWKNIFGIDIAELRKNLFENQENLSSAKLTKNFPRTIKIALQSYPELFQTIIQEKNYLVLENGSIVPGTNEELPSLDLLFEDFPDFYEYKTVLKWEELARIYELHDRIRTNFISVDLEKINYFVEAKEAHFVLVSGNTIIFDLVTPPEMQIEKLAVFHQENQPIDTASLIYVDTRVEKRLYYCDTETEFDCYNNLAFIYWQNR